MTKFLLACGALSSVVYLTTIDAIAPSLFPEYHGYAAQMVSELWAVGAPTRTLMFWSGLLYNSLVIGFAIGVWRMVGSNGRLRTLAVTLLTYGLVSTIGGMLTPMDARSEGLPARTWVHIGVTSVQGLCQVGVLVAGAFALGPRFRLYSLASLLLALLLGAWAGYQSSQPSAPWLGLTERGSIYVYMIWIFVLALVLLAQRGVRFMLALEAHAVLTYYVIAFAISWGGVLLMLGGPSRLVSSSGSDSGEFQAGVLVTLSGPPIAGILMTALVSGRQGLGALLVPLSAWRRSSSWYAIALLTAPLSVSISLFSLWWFSDSYLPGYLGGDDVTAPGLPFNSAISLALVAGPVTGFIEELGWTGFAVPRLVPRHGVLRTGVLAGFLWGLWHLVSNLWGSGQHSLEMPLAIYLAGLLFTFLPPCRVLMVWVYDRTKSLLLVMLMHASLVISWLLSTPRGITGEELVVWYLTWGALLWLIVAGVLLLRAEERSVPETVSADSHPAR